MSPGGIMKALLGWWDSGVPAVRARGEGEGEGEGSVNIVIIITIYMCYNCCTGIHIAQQLTA